MSENVSKSNMDPFENPELKPLEDLKLIIKTNALSETVPALSKHWIEERYFLHYASPQLYEINGTEIIGAKDQWLELVGHITDDVNWLLGLPHYRFWSHIVYVPSVMDMLISFLQEAPPFYALDDFPNVPEMIDTLHTLHRLILVTFARLVTNKESPAAYMSPTFHGTLLYDNYIFTIPVMLDLSQHYGRENGKTVERILNSLFRLQPLYNKDLKKCVPFLIQVFRAVEQRFEDRPIPLADEVVSLSERGGASTQITLPTLEDFVIHLLDVSSNIAVFLENYPLAADAFRTEDFMNKIVSIYGNTIPEMYKKLEGLAYKDETMVQYLKLKHRLDVTRIELLRLYRTIIFKPIRNILEKMSPSIEIEVKKHVDDYLTILTNALSEKEFIGDYHLLYPVDMDLDILSQICPEVDGIKCDFILQSIYVASNELDIKKPTPTPLKNISEATAGPSNVQNSQPSTSKIADESNECKKTEIELASLISEVKDILCHLGEGYIEKCLKHYNYNSTSVINAILEDSLPSDLKELDPTLPYIPPDPMEASASVDLAIGLQRLNVFDNDEFDIMTRDTIDLSRVHKGKRKGKYKNLSEMLNDKSYKEKFGDIYAKYSLISDDYEDEYDDTYESHDVGLSARDEPLEMDARPFTTPRVFLTRDKNDIALEEEEESDEENSTDTQNDRNQFVQDPAEMRARAEQRRQLRRGGKGPPPVQQKDVVGKPKGQGQDNKVIANRDKKNKHKSSQANHNRRAGAQWKRNQGLLPS